MTVENPRSGQVIEAYKRHKLAVSALHGVQRLLREFERGRAADRRLAWVGIAIILSLTAIALLFFFGGERVILS